MGIGVAAVPLRLKRTINRPFPQGRFGKKPRRGASSNALLGAGLWALLWLGYNTSVDVVRMPNFPANTMQLIHGLRSFFPILSAWISLLIIFVRGKRLIPWVMGPMGLMLLYGVTGLAVSVSFSSDPVETGYWACNYLAIVLALLAISLVDDPLADIRYVLKFTWIIGILMTFGLLGAVPYLGETSSGGADWNAVGPHAYSVGGTVAGMAMTRNTGFARYAAISALVALSGVIRNNKPYIRFIWAGVLGASLYALALANGRTETLAFVGGVILILIGERAKRVVNLLVGAGAGLLLGIWGFYSAFYLYITRTGKFDPTLTGRTSTWEEGWHYIWESPWVGLGFQADRYYLNTHMHNAFLHVLIQSGILGGGAILLGLLIASFYLIKYFFVKPPEDRSLIPTEMVAIFLFVFLSSFTESTFAYFSAAWLLSAPIVAYAVALHRRVRKTTVKAEHDRALQVLLERRRSQNARHPLRVTHSA